MNSHLRDPECHERDRYGGSMDQMGLRSPEGGDRETDRER
jgi:hypothetical protein